MRAFVALLFSATSFPAMAHPGEHNAGLLASLWHLVADPYHLALIAAVVVVGTLAGIRLRTRAKAGSE